MSIEEVRALVAERQRYDDWLAALDAKRADTPPRVFERVYGDYVGRRTDVLSRLQSHVDELAALGQELEQRLAALEMRLAAHEEERAEGMLRNLVGEYDDDRWDAVRQEIEARIEALGGERGALLVEVEDVRALLTSARVPEQSEAVPPTVTTLVPALAVEDSPLDGPAIVDEAVSEPTSAELAPVNGPAAFDTSWPDADYADIGEETLLGIDEAMADGPDVPEPAPDPVSVAAKGPVTEREVDDALAMFGDVSGPADRQFVQSLDGIEVEQDTLSGWSAAADAPGVDDPFDDLAFLRSVIDQEEPGNATPAPVNAGAPASAAPAPTAPALPADTAAADTGEAQKTLRCTECGTMNLPTEWYCERCGGELAAF